MESGSYNTSREGEEGVPVAAMSLPQIAHAPQDDEEWETEDEEEIVEGNEETCLLYTSPSPRDLSTSRMPSSA